MFRIAPIAAVFGLILASANASASTTPADAQRHVYIVTLRAAPLVEHAEQRVAARGLAKSLGSHKQAMRVQMASDDGAAYLRTLDEARESIVAAASMSAGRALAPTHVYRYASNGLALKLTSAEAARMAALPGVVSVRPERMLHVQTDAGPEWIGADKLWNGDVPGIAATRGEGVVVGVIDTGINPTHPAFAATGPDSYAIVNPRGHYYGLCASFQATCNDKLIGMYDFTDEGTKGVDSVGHGSHVSGIVAGDAMTNALPGNTVSLPRFVSGVAPHANLIMYKACKAVTTGTSGGCPESGLVAAINQAVADGVDVINYSIGGDTVDAWQLLRQSNNDASAFFLARSAGIVVVAAAGNEGPGSNSIDEPGNVPWVIGVANASHNRRFSDSLGDFSGAPNAPPKLNGVGYTAGYGPKPIVYAGDYGNALCGTGPDNFPPTGASNPFPPGTFHGEIVVCDRGIYARVEKGYNVKLGGAGGYILANAASDGESIVSDDHYLPAVHLGYSEGQQLENWLKVPGTHLGTISGVTAVLDDRYGDILEASSSRGPYGFGGGILKPDITAPGTNILSAAQTGSGLALLTGTSMASPHVAGAAALLVAVHPDWSPSQVESALMGTALSGSVRKEDAVTLASPLGAGAGRAQPAAAALAGLYLPMSATELRSADPTKGGDPAQLNRTGIESENCLNQCSFTRSVTDMSSGGTWLVTTTATTGAKLAVTPTQFTLAAGASQTLNIALDVTDPRLPGSWVDGRVVLHKISGKAATDTALTVAAYVAAGTAPGFRQFSANAPSGTTQFLVGGLTALPHATFATTSLEAAAAKTLSLGVDTKSGDLYSTFPGDGKDFVLYPLDGVSGDAVPSGASSVRGRIFVVEIASSTATQAHLYAGIDSNGNGQPDQVEQVCESSGALARCVIDLRDAPAGAINAWALVDIPGSSTGATYSVTLNAAVPLVGMPVNSAYDNSTGTLVVSGPGHASQSVQIPLRLSWGPVLDGKNQAIAPGKYYGAVLIDAESGLNGQTAFVPFSFIRSTGNNDVADGFEPDATRNYAIEAGELLQHQFIDVPGAGTLLLSTQYSDATNTSALDFYVQRADFPAGSSSPQVAAAPVATSGSARWSLGGATKSKSVTVPVSSGRWYIVAKNSGTGQARYGLHAQLNSTQIAALPPPGAYYNPQRSGHGIFVSQAGGLQVMYWYTYLEDGTPVWYGASGPQPTGANPVWKAPLYSVNWDGAAVNKVTVLGDVTITPISSTEFTYSWHLNGSAGSERFSQLSAANLCTTLNGQPANFNGQWYAPTQSGYGMDVLALSGLQNDTFYFYDDLGMPHWAVGSANPFSASSTLNMYQLNGFCPVCNFVNVGNQVIGTMMVDYSSATAGHYSTDMNLMAPLSGAWKINQPIVRLTGSPVCSP
ncbi:MAG: S8 family serine peptidase [Rudaea sp.]